MMLLRSAAGSNINLGVEGWNSILDVSFGMPKMDIPFWRSGRWVEAGEGYSGGMAAVWSLCQFTIHSSASKFKFIQKSSLLLPQKEQEKNLRETKMLIVSNIWRCRRLSKYSSSIKWLLLIAPISLIRKVDLREIKRR
jgi:hypothetical protein